MKIPTRYQVILLSALVFMAMFNLTLVSPMLPRYMEDRFGETSAIYIGIFTSAEMLAYIIFAPVWGVLSDRTGKRVPYVVLGLGLSAVLFAIMPSIDNYWALVAVRFLQGIFTVAAWSLAMTMALDWAGEENRGRTMGVLGTGMMMGMAIGAALGGNIADRWVLEGPFYVASVVFGIAFVLAWAFLSEPTHRRKKVKATIPLSEEKDLWIPSAYGFIERFTAGFFITLFPKFLQEIFDLSIGISGMYLGLFFLPFGILQYAFGRLTDKWGPLPFIVAGSLVYGAIMIVITYLQPTGIALAMFCLGAMAAGMLPASLVLVGTFSRPETHGRAMGLFNAMGSVGFAIGLMISAVFAVNWGYSVAFILGGLSVIIVVGLTAISLFQKFKWMESTA